MKKKELQEKIAQRLKEYIVKKKLLPSSTKELLKGAETGKTYASVVADPKELFHLIMEGFITDTLSVLEQDENYAEMTVREKLLSFYFVFVEQIKEDEEFLKVVFSPRQFQLLKLVKNAMRPPFIEFIDQIVQEGILNEEIKSRMVLDKVYGMTLEKDLMLVLKFWLKDGSEAKEKTDELIERLVHLEMNALGPNFMDDLIGLGKMMLENSPLSKYMSR
ncbi:MAG: hypothetical protein R2799_02400 [Crocinitomicaceae bacterium]